MLLDIMKILLGKQRCHLQNYFALLSSAILPFFIPLMKITRHHFFSNSSTTWASVKFK